MSFTPIEPELRCADCWCEITLEQYRRKVPRCDDCEVDAATRRLDPVWLVTGGLALDQKRPPR